MSANGFKSAQVRAKLDHPIIDTDGHTVEFTPVFFDYIREVGGAGMIERYKNAVGSRSNNRWMELSHTDFADRKKDQVWKDSRVFYSLRKNVRTA